MQTRRFRVVASGDRRDALRGLIIVYCVALLSGLGIYLLSR